MMGGGFGGCTINLIGPRQEKNSVRNVIENISQATGIEPELYDVNMVNGACEMVSARTVVD